VILLSCLTTLSGLNTILKESPLFYRCNLAASASGTSTQTNPSGAIGFSKSEPVSGSRLNTVASACAKPMTAIAQMDQKSKGLTVIGPHRNGQSVAGFSV